MASEPLVSIVLPTYNRAGLLPKAIDAILGQTHRSIELIVVNDGSADGTRDVLSDYAAHYPQVRFLNKDNGGIAEALNDGFLLSRGAFLSWTSDDNLYHPSAIASMLALLQANPDIGLVYAGQRAVDGAGRVTHTISAPPPGDIWDTCVVGACFLYRRAVMERTGRYNPRWPRCQDYDYWLRISRHFRMARIPEILYDYSYHEGTMSANHVEHILEEARVLSAHAPDAFRRRMYWARNLGHLGRYAEQRGEAVRSLWFHGRACLHEPRRIPEFGRACVRLVHASSPGWARSVWRRAKAAWPAWLRA